MDSRTATGSIGEDATAASYRSRGFRIVARNWRCALGELDLVAARGDLLVFCEVKTRRGSGFGGGYEAVGWKKRKKVRQLAETFLQQTGARAGSIRFDVASVALGRDGRPDIEVFEDAF